MTTVGRRNLAYEDVFSSAEESLDRLGNTDVLLMHTPSRSVPIEDSILYTIRKPLADARYAGLVSDLFKP